MKSLLCVLLTIFSGGIFAQTEKEIIPIEKNTKQDCSTGVFVMVQKMPIFKYKDCKTTNESFQEYVLDSIRIKAANCVGKIYIQFIVEPDSTIDNIKILREFDTCEGQKEEAERIILSMPKWIPGKQNGKEVRVMMTMPLDFKKAAANKTDKP